VARGGSLSAIPGLRDIRASCTSNRTTDTRIFSSVQWFMFRHIHVDFMDFSAAIHIP
jgi:hypothetical protein